jgi:hypothetical protein
MPLALIFLTLSAYHLLQGTYSTASTFFILSVLFAVYGVRSWRAN